MDDPDDLRRSTALLPAASEVAGDADPLPGRGEAAAPAGGPSQPSVRHVFADHRAAPAGAGRQRDPGRRDDRAAAPSRGARGRAQAPADPRSYPADGSRADHRRRRLRPLRRDAAAFGRGRRALVRSPADAPSVRAPLATVQGRWASEEPECGGTGWRTVRGTVGPSNGRSVVEPHRAPPLRVPGLRDLRAGGAAVAPHRARPSRSRPAGAWDGRRMRPSRDPGCAGPCPLPDRVLPQAGSRKGAVDHLPLCRPKPDLRARRARSGPRDAGRPGGQDHGPAGTAGGCHRAARAGRAGDLCARSADRRAIARRAMDDTPVKMAAPCTGRTATARLRAYGRGTRGEPCGRHRCETHGERGGSPPPAGIAPRPPVVLRGHVARGSPARPGRRGSLLAGIAARIPCPLPCRVRAPLPPRRHPRGSGDGRAAIDRSGGPVEEDGTQGPSRDIASQWTAGRGMCAAGPFATGPGPVVPQGLPVHRAPRPQGEGRPCPPPGHADLHGRAGDEAIARIAQLHAVGQRRGARRRTEASGSGRRVPRLSSTTSKAGRTPGFPASRPSPSRSAAPRPA